MTNLKELLISDHLKELENRLKSLDDKVMLKEAIGIITENKDKFEGRDKLDAVYIKQFGEKIPDEVYDEFLGLIPHLLDKLSVYEVKEVPELTPIPIKIEIPKEILEVENKIKERTGFKSAEDFWDTYQTVSEKIKQNKPVLYYKIRYSTGKKELPVESIIKLAFEEPELTSSLIHARIPGLKDYIVKHSLSGLYLANFLKRKARGKYEFNPNFGKDVKKTEELHEKVEVPEKIYEIKESIKAKLNLGPEEFWQIYQAQRKKLPESYWSASGYSDKTTHEIFKLFLEKEELTVDSANKDKSLTFVSPYTIKNKMSVLYKMKLLNKGVLGAYTLNHDFGKLLQVG